jgi:hypothetical protein
VNLSDNRGMPPPSPGEDRERRLSAVFRLKHDLGKAVRWSAPARRERDPEALRRRLEADLTRTRSAGGRTQGAVELFDAWRSEEADAFRDEPSWAERIGRIAGAVQVLRSLLPRLEELEPAELARLDEASEGIAEEARELWRDVVAASRSEEAEAVP